MKKFPVVKFLFAFALAIIASVSFACFYSSLRQAGHIPLAVSTILSCFTGYAAGSIATKWALKE